VEKDGEDEAGATSVKIKTREGGKRKSGKKKKKKGKILYGPGTKKNRGAIFGPGGSTRGGQEKAKEGGSWGEVREKGGSNRRRTEGHQTEGGGIIAL